MTTREKWHGFVEAATAQYEEIANLKAEAKRLVALGIRVGLVVPPPDPEKLKARQAAQRSAERAERRRFMHREYMARVRLEQRLSRGTSQVAQAQNPAKPTIPPQTPHRAAGSALSSLL